MNPDPAMAAAEHASPLIALGEVRHTRLRPVHHAFAYPNYFWMLPLRRLARSPVDAVKRNRWGLLSFHDADHGTGGPDALAWLEGVLADSGVDAATLADWRQGEVWLQTFPRVLGFAFKPVSFWWVHRADRSLVAVVAEVNSTFGERHAYVLDGPGLKLGRQVVARKRMHVSPFCEVSGHYRFRFMRTGDWGVSHQRPQDHVLVCIDHDNDEGPLLQTSQGGVLHPLDAAMVRRAFWGMPLMTWGVVARIHWQALRVWLKGVPFHTKPDQPPAALSRGEHP